MQDMEREHTKRVLKTRFYSMYLTGIRSFCQWVVSPMSHFSNVGRFANILCHFASVLLVILPPSKSKFTFTCVCCHLFHSLTWNLLILCLVQPDQKLGVYSVRETGASTNSRSRLNSNDLGDRHKALNRQVGAQCGLPLYLLIELLDRVDLQPWQWGLYQTINL